MNYRLRTLSRMSNMTLLLGKRKRRADILEPTPNERTNVDQDNPDNLQALFRKHFEAQFAPLDKPSQPRKPLETIDSEIIHDEPESDWEGISNDGVISANIIEYQDPELRKEEIPPEEFKSFMVGVLHTLI